MLPSIGVCGSNLYAASVLGVVTLSLCLQIEADDQPAEDSSDDKDGPYKYCYADDSHPYTLFSSKTPYETNMANPPPPLELPNCTLLQIWTLVRHGTRFAGRPELPHLYDLKNTRDRMLLSKTCHLCEKDRQNFREWDFYGTPDMHNILTPQGYREVKALGVRYRERFADFFKANYSRDAYLFYSSLARRAVHSGHAFADGIFGEDANVHFPPPDEYDAMLSGYKHCPTFENAFDDDNPRPVQREYKKLIESDIFKKLIHEVSTRIGLTYDLEFRTLQHMYFMCAYDNSWTPEKVSPWCAIFTKDHLKLFEFSEDLYYYYKLGYGLEMNEQLGCPPIRHMLLSLNDTVGNGGVPSKKAYFFFSHSGLFQRMTATLGMFKDPYPIVWNSYINTTRKWRSSFIDPFGSSFSAFLYKCDEDEFCVVFYVNERVWHFNFCNRSGVCTWKQIMDKFGKMMYYENCNTEFCYENSKHKYEDFYSKW